MTCAPLNFNYITHNIISPPVNCFTPSNIGWITGATFNIGSDAGVGLWEVVGGVAWFWFEG